MKRNYLLVICLNLLFCFLLASCDHSDKQRSLQKYVDSVNARAPQPIPPLPQISTPASYHYQSTEKRSPFSEKLIQKDDGKSNQPDLNRPKDPLEAYPIDSLSMVGTLSEEGNMVAMISTRDGTIHLVHVGNYMGQNFGKIIAITEKAIKVEETVNGPRGWEKRIIDINLQSAGR